MIATLTEDNFELYSAQHYMNIHCETMEEFQEDLFRFKYLKKLFYSYKKKKNVLKERLILNHIIILYNIFDAKACTRMLTLKLEDYLDCLFPFLIAMDYLSSKDFVDGLKDENFRVYVSDVMLDKQIVDKLREIIRK